VSVSASNISSTIRIFMLHRERERERE